MDEGSGSRLSPSWPVLPESDRERLRPFLARLARMSKQERIWASRFSFTSWERGVWAGRYPEEVPLVNGEFEWIALNAE